MHSASQLLECCVELLSWDGGREKPVDVVGLNSQNRLKRSFAQYVLKAPSIRDATVLQQKFFAYDLVSHVERNPARISGFVNDQKYIAVVQ